MIGIYYWKLLLEIIIGILWNFIWNLLLEFYDWNFMIGIYDWNLLLEFIK